MRLVEVHRATYVVEPICHAIGMAPSMFYEHQARQRDPARAPTRSRREAELRPSIKRCWHANQSVYCAKYGR